MDGQYCVDCEHLEERPVMAEVGMFSGVYEQNGSYYRRKECGRCFSMNANDMEFQTCICGKFGKKG